MAQNFCFFFTHYTLAFIAHFQATWHPFYEDLCVIGRYPASDDTDKTRCVDIIDLKKGIIAGQFYDPNATQIMTVSEW